MPTQLSLPEKPDGMPLHRWAYEGLRRAILDGRLPSGSRLPSSRELARQLGMARGTVVGVFEQLTAEGYLASREGSGTFVADALPDSWFQVREPVPRGRTGARQGSLSRFGRGLRASPFPLSIPPNARPFRAHLPALEAFPHDLWSRIVARHARHETRAGLQGGDAAGVAVLRQALIEHLRVARGVEGSAEHVVVTSGAQQTLDLATRLVLDPGDRAWVEDPGYFGARVVLEAAGAEIVPVPVDDNGMRVELGIRRAPDAKLAYVTPAHHAPLGVTLPAERRMALLDWASESGAWLFEDDYNSEFRYESRPVAALQALDRSGVVLHTGSFSKTMFPGLRLAYAVVPDGLRDRFVMAKSVLDRFTAPLAQVALAEFIGEGHYGRHLRRMRELYAERRAALLDALSHEMGDELEVVGADASIDLVVRLPAHVDDREVADRLNAAGLVVEPLSSSAIRLLARGGLVLGFASFTPAKLRAAVSAMRKTLEPLLRARRSRRAVTAQARAD